MILIYIHLVWIIFYWVSTKWILWTIQWNCCESNAKCDISWTLYCSIPHPTQTHHPMMIYTFRSSEQKQNNLHTLTHMLGNMQATHLDSKFSCFRFEYYGVFAKVIDWIENWFVFIENLQICLILKCMRINFPLNTADKHDTG